ncbi:hypothetical protein [Vibrio scophthalmi]|uniref:Uncharacterized protein n=1 Tax=Vibrio scophthalmi LMG 19158 TaxID=870967 RepID=F9RI98_9VIBR|nr:hypothetical protein [Vibrio scophthalmi]EGU42430.1 hypothetical protein VIS19158_11553 [Vibrio scophthalmi LMG 19158]
MNPLNLNRVDEVVDARLRILLADYFEFESIIQKLPINVKESLANVLLEIESLNKSLDSIPNEFDERFSKKMNQIVAVTEEIDKHSTTLADTLRDVIADMSSKNQAFQIEANNQNQAILEQKATQFEAAAKEHAIKLEEKTIWQLQRSINGLIVLDKFYICAAIVALPILTSLFTICVLKYFRWI